MQTQQLATNPVVRANTCSSQTSILGWFAGLAYYNWFAGDPISVPFWAQIILIIGGLFASSIIIGGGLAILAGIVTKVVTGRFDGSPNAFAWAALVSPVLNFIAVRYALLLFSSPA
ncbi:MAG: hypothetical protein QF733_00645 [Phycisphaerales bacterium]|jgi:hypothetical protein|nr:hypothetical protein [Phycisphaerales bacterium]